MVVYTTFSLLALRRQHLSFNLLSRFVPAAAVAFMKYEGTRGCLPSMILHLHVLLISERVRRYDMCHRKTPDQHLCALLGELGVSTLLIVCCAYRLELRLSCCCGVVLYLSTELQQC